MRLRYGPDYRKQFLEPDELGILVVGRIAPEKNMDWVVKLYRELRSIRGFLSLDAYFKKIKLTVIGGSSSVYQNLFSQLKKQTAEASVDTANCYASGSVTLEW